MRAISDKQKAITAINDVNDVNEMFKKTLLCII